MYITPISPIINLFIIMYLGQWQHQLLCYIMIVDIELQFSFEF